MTEMTISNYKPFLSHCPHSTASLWVCGFFLPNDTANNSVKTDLFFQPPHPKASIPVFPRKNSKLQDDQLFSIKNVILLSV